MSDVIINLNNNKQGGFYQMEGEERIGEMEVSITDKTMTVYHTEVAPQAEGKGIAKKLLHAMVDYARKENLKVTPLCPYVLAQFRRHPDDFADVWNKETKEF